jgi:hypothetical protein
MTVPGAFAVVRHYLLSLIRVPKARAAKTQPALRSASERIASVAIPKVSCAMIPDRIAMAAATTTDKMGMTTRPMQAQ